MRRPLAILTVVVVALVGAALAGCDSEPRSERGSRIIAAGDRVAAPVVRGPLMDGSGTFDLTGHRGDVVVVNFWASYCAPCRTEAPDLEAVLAATKADNVRFIGINVRDQRDPAMAYLTDVKPGYGSIFDPAAKLAIEFDVPPNTIPATLLIDRQGRIAAVFRSIVTRAVLEPAVRSLVAEPK